MTTYQYMNLLNILRDILVRQDWFNNFYRDQVSEMSLSELVIRVSRLNDGQEIIKTVYRTVGI